MLVFYFEYFKRKSSVALFQNYYIFWS